MTKDLTYHYLLFSQTDLLQNQVLEEILRERATFYSNQEKSRDFWILLNPSFLKDKIISDKIEQTNYYLNEKNKINSDSSDAPFFVSIVSLNKEFIKWIELRLGYFENINLEKLLLNNTKLTSNGIVGKFENKELNKINPLESESSFLDYELLLKKYRKILKQIYKITN